MLKRIVDILISSFSLVVLSPVLIVLGLLVSIDSPGPIFYRASRVGRSGTPFKLYKFRSMVVNADTGPKITTAGDARVTKMGRFLRQTKLDELPQLINVLNGDMSLVGPRPEDPRYVALYSSEQREVLKVRPGITSPASVVYRHEERLLTGSDWENFYTQTLMPAKLAIDLDYARHPSLWRDITIILKTFHALFK